MAILKDKIALVHVAKNRLNLTDDNYKDILRSLGVKEETSKNLTDDQFKKLMNIFAGLGFTSNKRQQDKREIWGCSDGQKKMIIGLWMQKAKYKTIKALQSFIYRIVKKSAAFLEHRDVEKIINAIKNMK